jgi:hypothetical protein
MSKNKFWTLIILGMITGLFISPILSWLGFNISFTYFFTRIFNEPTFFMMVSLVGLVVVLLFLIRMLYKKYVNF